jgi:alkyl hydroperoxide reductase subunit F
MLDPNLKTQLAGYLDRIQMPIELVASLDDSEAARELDALLDEIAALSPKITRRAEPDPRTPSFAIRRAGAPEVAVRFAGLPLGHEFTSLVLALLQVGGHPPKVDAALLERARALAPRRIETYYSLSCQNCPDVVQALNLLAIVNPGIDHVAIDGALFRAEVEARDVMAVPAVFVDGALLFAGRKELAEILDLLDGGAGTNAAARVGERAPYDVLIVGGGPAGAAAAIYAARKGLRTGLVAERFGGQVLDTAAIENFISVAETEGPKLAADLERHVRAYEVDLLVGHRAERLVPAVGRGLHEVALAGGATLKARSVILATGARWRTLGVLGEEQYRNRGVAFCPHCDGPLFKGKRVAVIGGGNSGVEAAIDLAGLATHVTLIEYMGQLRADEVLQRRLRSLPNVTIVVEAETTEILGDGRRVTGLVYRDRTTGAPHTLSLDGVFVQIGLVPNTEWLRGTLPLSKYGEIVIDERGRTAIPGILAAGDATTEPYKQIVIAMGAGSTAALAAFDHLIRQSTDSSVETRAA